MKVKGNQILNLETKFNPFDNISVTLESNERTAISAWRSSFSKLTPIEFLKKCHEELGKMIKTLEETEDIYELNVSNERKWWEFWKI